MNRAVERGDAVAVSSRTPSRARMVLVATAVLLAIGIMALALLVPRRYGGEEPTLLNPPYMVWKYGQVSFPAYGFWYHSAYHTLVFHPPPHYEAVGYLLKAGVPLYYAEALPPLLIALLGLVLVVSLPLSPPIRLGVLLGFGSALGLIATVGANDYAFHLRPDLHLTTAWFAGLLLCEHARRRGWRWPWVCAAVLMLVHASTVHYSGILGVGALAVYGVVAWKELGYPRCMRVFGIALAAGAVAILPVLLFYALPSWDDIRVVMTDANATAGWIERWSGNFATYAVVHNRIGREGWLGLLYARPLVALLSLRIPPFLVGAGILAFIPELRAFALAALPIPLFIFFYSPRKDPSYLYPEIILLFVALWVLVAIVAGRNRTTREIRWRPVRHAVLTAVVLFAIALTTPPLALARLSLPEPHELTVARRAAREIVGDHAIVAAQHGMWYVSGGSEWLDPTADLLWKIPEIDPHDYWRQLDALCVYVDSPTATNTGRNEVTLLREGIVHPLGFYMSRRTRMPGWMWLTARDERPFRGFFWRGDQLMRFDANPNGDHSLWVGETRKDDRLSPRDQIERATRRIGGLVTLPLPLPTEAATRRTDYVYFILAPAVGTVQPHDDESLRETVRGSVTPIAFDRWFENPDRDRITFAQTWHELSARFAVPLDAGTPAQWIGALTPKQGDVALGTTTSVRADRVGGEWLVRSHEIAVQPNTLYVVTYELTLREGHSAFHVLDEDGKTPLVTLRRDVPQDWTRERFVVYSGNRTRLTLLLAADNAYKRPIDIGVRDVTIARAKLTR
jgi:hypothetical protein